MKKEQKSYIYTVSPDGVSLWLYSKASRRVNNEVNVYLQGDDAALFLKEVKDTEDVWENSKDMTKDILKRNFESIEGHVSYIISQYF